MFSNWSRDGKWIYFSSNRSGTTQVWKMPSDGGPPIQVTRNGGFGACELQDGRNLIFTLNARRGTSLWEMPLAGGPETLISSSVVLVNFAVSHRGIYYMTVDPHTGHNPVNFVDFGLRKRSLIATIEASVYAGLALSPDERWLLFAQTNPSTSNLMLVENFE